MTFKKEKAGSYHTEKKRVSRDRLRKDMGGKVVTERIDWGGGERSYKKYRSSRDIDKRKGKS